MCANRFFVGSIFKLLIFKHGVLCMIVVSQEEIENILVCPFLVLLNLSNYFKYVSSFMTNTYINKNAFQSKAYHPHNT